MNPRLALVLLLGFSLHLATFASRTATPLVALRLGEGAFAIGLLLSVYSVLPIFLSIPAGRWVDRVGARRPLLLSSAMQACGLLLPALWPSAWPVLPALAVSALLIGTAHMFAIIGLNNVTGAISTAGSRGSIFVWLAMSFSTGVMLGPLLAGFALDHGGPRAPFGLAALVIVAVAVTLAVNRKRIPDTRHRSEAASGHLLELLRAPMMRQVLAISIVGPLCWDLFYLFIPLHGTAIGLSASQIGMVLSAFAVAIFAVRVFSPMLQRRLDAWSLLGLCFGIGAACLALFPLATGTLSLGAASFCFGLCLGLSSPLQMYLTYEVTPEGRKGEITGLRQTIFNTIATVAPTSIAAISAAVGFGPVIWATSLGMAVGGRFAWITGRAGRRRNNKTRESA